VENKVASQLTAPEAATAKKNTASTDDKALTIRVPNRSRGREKALIAQATTVGVASRTRCLLMIGRKDGGDSCNQGIRKPHRFNYDFARLRTSAVAPRSKTSSFWDAPPWTLGQTPTKGLLQVCRSLSDNGTVTLQAPQVDTGSDKPRLHPAIFLLAPLYVVGLVGWVWDDLEHTGVTDFGASFAHLLMNGAFLLAALFFVIDRALRPVMFSRKFTNSISAPFWPLLIVLGGVMVDMIWHAANPDSRESNMLLLPGHAIQLIGWVVGLGACIRVFLRTISSNGMVRMIS
jgi:hypothetical protein